MTELDDALAASLGFFRAGSAVPSFFAGGAKKLSIRVRWRLSVVVDVCCLGLVPLPDASGLEVRVEDLVSMSSRNTVVFSSVIVSVVGVGCRL